jgi:predicted RNase H-like nuclease (RuvC/YqgF family)
MSEQENAAAIAQLSAEIVQLKNENETLKKTFRQFSDSVRDAVRNDIELAQKKMTEFLGDRVETVDKKAQSNTNDLARIKEQLDGDGKDEPGLRTMLKLLDGRTSTLELDKRDRSTVLSFGKAAWGIAGTLVFGLVVASINSTIAEKAKSAANTQAENKQKFDALDNKVSNNNTKFFESIGELNKFKSASEKEFEWIKRSLK